MTANAVIQGTYADWKIIRGRKVCQIVVEIPLEAANDAAAILGMPNPAEEQWVAVALLNKSAAKGSEPTEGQKAVKTLAQRAFDRSHAVCGERSFQIWVQNHTGPVNGDPKVVAAGYIRHQCGIASRSELRTNPEAVEKFRRLMASYEFDARMT